MIVETCPVGMIQTNAYVVGDEENGDGVVIDPGGDPEQLLAVVEHHGLKIRYILNTHAHFDHTEANGPLVEATGAPLALHPLDKPILAAAGGAGFFGLRLPVGPPPDLDLAHGDVLEVGKLRFQVLHTPGHSPGHVCFYLEDERVVFDGDLLFYREVGRTDMQGGSWSELTQSIEQVLFALPDDTVVYPGHGPATTIGAEKRLNPWV